MIKLVLSRKLLGLMATTIPSRAIASAFSSAVGPSRIVRNLCAFPLRSRSTRYTFCSSSRRSSTTMAVNGKDSHRSVEFPLSPTAALVIRKGDITKWFVDGSTDAIVNPANERMLGGGGADGAIHRAAGPELRDACYKIPEVRPGVRCPTGEARITPGFKLPVSHVIHTVGPIYDQDPDPEGSLRNAYINSLRVANENNIKYIAFPAISCGVYGYPYDEAASVAIASVKDFKGDLKQVHFVLFADEIFDAWVKKATDMLQK